MLLPEELSFLKYLKEAKVPLNEYEFPPNKLANVQSQLEKLVEKNYYLHQAAKEAFRSYILAYNSHHLKETFNIHSLDLKAVAKSFGFTSPPKVNINIESKAANTRKAKKVDYKRDNRFGGHTFSASNPYGKRKEGDNRQFS